MMENPPCKEEYANDEDRRTRRYLLARNVKWTKNIVTYNIVNTPSTISMGDVEATFRRAFDVSHLLSPSLLFGSITAGNPQLIENYIGVGKD